MSEEIYEIRLEKVIELNSKIAALRVAILNAPCLVARPGETTYECRHDNLCSVCKWRQEVAKEFKMEYGENLFY